MYEVYCQPYYAYYDIKTDHCPAPYERCEQLYGTNIQPGQWTPNSRAPRPQIQCVKNLQKKSGIVATLRKILPGGKSRGTRGASSSSRAQQSDDEDESDPNADLGSYRNVPDGRGRLDEVNLIPHASAARTDLVLGGSGSIPRD